jgi:hypothetical protein
MIGIGYYMDRWCSCFYDSRSWILFSRSLHTHVMMVIPLGELGTIERRRPRKSKLPKNRLTSLLDCLTDEATGTDRG